ncbi:DUF2249 domain-containing protein [Roseibium litorale]|uniref:DUF2249 domain-containing protein n=1 Tax=Roseibium litorale TaxID=2803841 RepID=A0ABR9CJE9_9HYPH|nr:DUF2249 domain-containing protein [Roseibium litorale]MBD8890957.1 DUF2249 domain-containing protein [Roseibium litorale]
MASEPAPYTHVLNVSGMPCASRRTAVLLAFEALLPGQSFEIVNDRDWHVHSLLWSRPPRLVDGAALCVTPDMRALAE